MGIVTLLYFLEVGFFIKLSIYTGFNEINSDFLGVIFWEPILNLANFFEILKAVQILETTHRNFDSS